MEGLPYTYTYLFLIQEKYIKGDAMPTSTIRTHRQPTPMLIAYMLLIIRIYRSVFKFVILADKVG